MSHDHPGVSAKEHSRDLSNPSVFKIHVEFRLGPDHMYDEFK